MSNAEGIEEMQRKPSLGSANFPTMDDGRTFHLQTRIGEIANRMITVGSHKRAELFSTFLDDPVRFESNRGFTVYTGTYKGVPVSIVAIGMGHPMMDMYLREAMWCCEGDFAIIRFGTCGAIRKEIRPGHICIAEDSILVTQNPDAWAEDHLPPPTSAGSSSGIGLSADSLPSSDEDIPAQKAAGKDYLVSKPARPDRGITELLVSNMKSVFGEERVHLGGNITSDSYFSTQGRQSVDFDDRNQLLVEELRTLYPSGAIMEMETFHLFHLARTCFRQLKVAAAAQVLAQRNSDEMITPTEIALVESQACGPLLDALVATPLLNVMDDERCIWNQRKK